MTRGGEQHRAREDRAAGLGETGSTPDLVFIEISPPVSCRVWLRIPRREEASVSGPALDCFPPKWCYLQVPGCLAPGGPFDFKGRGVLGTVSQTALSLGWPHVRFMPLVLA